MALNGLCSYAQNVVQAVPLNLIGRRNELSRVYFLVNMDNASSSAVSPGEGQGLASLTSVLIPFQKRRSSTRRECSPSRLCIPFLVGEASCVWWPTAKPSKHLHGLLPPELTGSPGGQRLCRNQAPQPYPGRQDFLLIFGPK